MDKLKEELSEYVGIVTDICKRCIKKKYCKIPRVNRKADCIHFMDDLVNIIKGDK